jgi:hypothetical protein
MKKTMLRSSLIIAAVIISLTLSGCQANLGLSKTKKLSPEEAKAKTEKYINDNLMAPGSKATIDKVTEENGLYKLSVNIGQGQLIDSYVTKDGSKFFPQALEMATTTPAVADDTETAAPTEITKNDKPVVELFVMSYCPYGTQIEKGILPVIKALGDKIDFTLKFCDYAMHGDKELTENMTQYCIQKEQNAKFSAYLTCFLEASDSAGCLTKAGVDKTKVNACVKATDTKYEVMAQKEKKGSYPAFNVSKDDNAKYNVGGSPTLIINGADVQSSRDSASLLKTICSAFNNAPEECKATLSSAAPSAGFGSGTDASGSAADCAN